MISKAKAAIRTILSSYKQSTVPSFENFKKCLEYCEAKTEGAYESGNLSRYRFEKLGLALSEGINLFNSPSMATLLFAVAIYQNQYPGEIPHIIDFGGACGESLYCLEKIFGDAIYSKSVVIESKGHVRESKNWDYARKVKFAAELNEEITMLDISIFFSSGAIQSIPDPYSPIIWAVRRKIPIIALTRNNFSDNPKVTAQQTNLSAHGSGKHIPSYGDPSIFCPNTSIDIKRILNILDANGYTCIENACDQGSGVNGENNFGADLIFTINT